MTQASPSPETAPPTASVHELLAIYWSEPNPRPRRPREFAFLCPACGRAHVLVGLAPVLPTTRPAPCGAQVRLAAGPPIGLPVALWRTHRQERMLAALYPALLRADQPPDVQSSPQDRLDSVQKRLASPAAQPSPTPTLN